LANSQTLGTTYSPRKRRTDIEVPNIPVNKDSKGILACYPWRIFYPLIDSLPTKNYRVIMTDNILSLLDLFILQSS